MKKNFRSIPVSAGVVFCLVACAVFISSCNNGGEECRKCTADFADEKRVQEIVHYDNTSALDARYRFYYQNSLIDSIVKVSYPGTGARTAADDSVVSALKVYYPSNSCVPSYYVLKTYADPVSVEKAFMSVGGNLIMNKHLAFYPDENFLVVDHTAEIDYLYNGSSQIGNRSGTDYGLLIYPNPYGNENFYTYTGNNITHVVAQKEQSGYNLDNVFDTRNNPFNIQGGVLYYLNLIAYTDEEFFETICQDENNPTTIVYQGTDTSNSFVTRTFTFTYSYDVDNYPTQVGIYEVEENDVYGNSETDHGTYLFQY